MKILRGHWESSRAKAKVEKKMKLVPYLVALLVIKNFDLMDVRGKAAQLFFIRNAILSDLSC